MIVVELHHRGPFMWEWQAYLDGRIVGAGFNRSKGKAYAAATRWVNSGQASAERVL